MNNTRMMKLLQVVVFSLALSPFLYVHTSATATATTTTSSSSLFIFGDTILDTGNNNYIKTIIDAQANFWPYGMTFFNFPTGRFSDGRLIGDFIAGNANLPLIPPFLEPGNHDFSNGVNFASAGAGALVQTFEGKVINLHTQERNYEKVKVKLRGELGEIEAMKIISKAVHLFSVGADDYLAIVLSNSPNNFTVFTPSHYVNMVISNLTSVIKEIYNKGGRKFAFMNVPQIACMPELRSSDVHGECLKEAWIYPILHNQALAIVLEQLQSDLPGFKYSLYDLYTHLQHMIEQPLIYGYKEGKSACCGTGEYNGIASCGRVSEFGKYELCKDVNDYVFWDSTHFTDKAHGLMAHEMWANETGSLSYGKYTVKDLFNLP